MPVMQQLVQIFDKHPTANIQLRVLQHFRWIHQGLDVAPILAELDAQSDLWDQHPERRTAPGSPHVGMTDVWVRARAYSDLQTPGAFREEHRPVFYPAWHRLPAIQPVVHGLMAMCHGVELGNVLITRIRPGQRVLPHVDTGWAPEFYTAKFYVVLRGNAETVNLAGTGDDEERVVMAPGSIWAFENRVTHSIENNGTSERISLIVTLRTEPSGPVPSPVVVDAAAGDSRGEAGHHLEDLVEA